MTFLPRLTSDRFHSIKIGFFRPTTFLIHCPNGRSRRKFDWGSTRLPVTKKWMVDEIVSFINTGLISYHKKVYFWVLLFFTPCTWGRYLFAHVRYQWQIGRWLFSPLWRWGRFHNINKYIFSSNNVFCIIAQAIDRRGKIDGERPNDQRQNEQMLWLIIFFFHINTYSFLKNKV